MLLDDVMPEYHFNVVALIGIQATPASIFRAIRETRPSDLPLAALLFWTRELPGRLTRREARYFPDRRRLLDEGFQRLGFLPLGEIAEREIVFGAAGRWWTPWGADFYHLADAQEFARFNRPGYVKGAANFRVQPAGTDRSLLRHETRIYALNAAARKKFAVYWRIIYPGVWLIRREWLRSIKQRAEAGRAS